MRTTWSLSCSKQSVLDLRGICECAYPHDRCECVQFLHPDLNDLKRSRTLEIRRIPFPTTTLFGPCDNSSSTIMASAATLPPAIESTRMGGRKRFARISLCCCNSSDVCCRSRSLSPDHSDGPPPPTRRRSRSPRPRVQLDLPKVNDVDPVRRALRERELAARMAAVELEKAAKPKEQESAQDSAEKQAEFAKLIGSRSGGVYVPPARLRALQAAASSDKSSPEYQRLSWDALRKSITGIVNRVNIANIKQVVPELFSENLIRGRGLFARSVMKAQSSSLPFTPVFAALVTIINTKLPQVGELLLTRLISQFRRAFKRNDKVSRLFMLSPG